MSSKLPPADYMHLPDGFSWGGLEVIRAAEVDGQVIVEVRALRSTDTIRVRATAGGRRLWVQVQGQVHVFDERQQGAPTYRRRGTSQNSP